MSESKPSTSCRGPALWVSVVLLLFAVTLLSGPFPFKSPVSAARTIPAWVTDPTPVRQPVLRPSYTVGVFTYRCSDCHRIIPSPPETFRTLTQHIEIQLDHGINTRCFNCHHPTNRDTFVDDFGAEIPWDQPQLLCAKCHGPVYRDWQHGSHGRTNGYWEPGQGPQIRRKCIECHDPHRPPFPALSPAPAPQTLRMGPRHAAGHTGVSNPLRPGYHADHAEAAEAPGEGR
jgi:hypothetical protein